MMWITILQYIGRKDNTMYEHKVMTSLGSATLLALCNLLFSPSVSWKVCRGA